MPVTAADVSVFEPREDGGWWLSRWASTRVAAGITDRQTEVERLTRQVCPTVQMVRAEQVHGASVAAFEGPAAALVSVAGCDALATRTPARALIIRTADCLPVFFADPRRDVVGLAHAGWRGLAADLPARMVSMLRTIYGSRPRDLRIAIGPAIRACCYEVGKNFDPRLAAYVQQRNGRATCDLVAAARDQLRAAGVSPAAMIDTGRCTNCEPDRWFSLRREGPSAGRLNSFILIQP
jgi:YfiH family protein